MSFGALAFNPLLAAHDQIVVQNLQIKLVLLHARRLQAHHDLVIVVENLCSEDAPTGAAQGDLLSLFEGAFLPGPGSGCEPGDGAGRVPLQALPPVDQGIPGLIQALAQLI